MINVKNSEKFSIYPSATATTCTNHKLKIKGINFSTIITKSVATHIVKAQAWSLQFMAAASE